MKLLLISSSLFLLISCQQVSETCSLYTKGFLFYLDDIHQTKLQDLPDDIIFYLLPLDGCDPCLQLNMDMLESFAGNKKIHLIFVGTSEEENFQNQAEKLRNNFQYFDDPKKETQAFEMNFGKPLLIHLQDHRCAHYKTVSDVDVEMAKAYLQTVTATN